MMEIIKSNTHIQSAERINLLVGSFAVLMVLLGKAWYTQADTQALFFLLQPVSWLVHLMSNQPYTYLPDQGFFFPNGNFLINAACSGFNWLLLAYLLGVFAGLRFTDRPFYKISLLFVFPPIVYLLCLLVNSMRILFSIMITDLIAQNGAWFHLAEGTFIYLSSLILWYLTCQIFFKTINSQI